jgi:hypothetical protein
MSLVNRPCHIGGLSGWCDALRSPTTRHTQSCFAEMPLPAAATRASRPKPVAGPSENVQPQVLVYG